MLKERIMNHVDEEDIRMMEKIKNSTNITISMQIYLKSRGYRIISEEDFLKINYDNMEYVKNDRNYEDVICPDCQKDITYEVTCENCGHLDWEKHKCNGYFYKGYRRNYSRGQYSEF